MAEFKFTFKEMVDLALRGAVLTKILPNPRSGEHYEYSVTIAAERGSGKINESDISLIYKIVPDDAETVDAPPTGDWR